jgi:hypothetical protein
MLCLITTHPRAAKPQHPRAGCFLNMLGLIFLGVSHTSDGVNLLHPGAILIGLGGITFHLAQVPRELLSSLLFCWFEDSVVCLGACLVMKMPLRVGTL